MKKDKTEVTVKYRNEVLRTWLKSHDLLNIAALCRRTNCNRGAFAHFIEGHYDMTEEPLTRIEQALIFYGYPVY